MSGKVIRIERVEPRAGVKEELLVTTSGYQLADPKNGNVKYHSDHAVFVRTLDEAATLVGHGFLLWMSQLGKRPSLITPASLRIVRA